MKLKDVAEIDREILRAEDVEKLLGLSAQCIRSQAQADPGKLGFPVIVCGSRVRIPKDGFLKFMGYGMGVQK